MKKLVIFDFDGTIADTSPGIVNSVRYTQKKMELPEIICKDFGLFGGRRLFGGK